MLPRSTRSERPTTSTTHSFSGATQCRRSLYRSALSLRKDSTASFKISDQFAPGDLPEPQHVAEARVVEPVPANGLVVRRLHAGRRESHSTTGQPSADHRRRGVREASAAPRQGRWPTDGQRVRWAPTRRRDQQERRALPPTQIARSGTPSGTYRRLADPMGNRTAALIRTGSMFGSTWFSSRAVTSTVFSDGCWRRVSAEHVATTSRTASSRVDAVTPHPTVIPGGAV